MRCRAKNKDGSRCKRECEGSMCWQHETDRKSPCKTFLKEKIRENMKEYKQGRFSSPKQAIAVSYSQTRKKYPNCS